MAGIAHEILIKAPGRPCWVYDAHRGVKGVRDPRSRRKGFLHLITTKSFLVNSPGIPGAHKGGQVSEAVAIIEDEHGSLREVELWQVQLLDTAEQIEESAAWEPKEEK